jgi:hypothetical protein
MAPANTARRFIIMVVVINKTAFRKEQRLHQAAVVDTNSE